MPQRDVRFHEKGTLMFVYVERIENIFYPCLVDTEECIVEYVAKIVFF